MVDILPQFSVAALGMSVAFIACAVLLHWALWIVAAFALVKVAGPMPFVAFYNGRVEAYAGWRPASGGFGFKLVVPGASMSARIS